MVATAAHVMYNALLSSMGAEAIPTLYAGEKEVFARLYDPDTPALDEDERARGTQWAQKAHDLMGFAQ